MRKTDGFDGTDDFSNRTRFTVMKNFIERGYDLTFKHWLLLNYSDKQDRFGDFARSAGSDQNFPESNNIRGLREYVSSKGSGLSVLNLLWANYQRDERTGANLDESFKNDYKDVWSLAWQTMKKAMRYDDKQERLKIWEDGCSYFIEHMACCSPEFASGLLNSVRDELIRSLERPEFRLEDVV